MLTVFQYGLRGVDTLEKQIKTLKIEKKEAEEAITALSDAPIIITDILIANTYKGGDIETDYGRAIYSENTMYLKPKIIYNGIDYGNKTLKVKWINPNGSLRTGDSSPYGFSQSDSYTIYSGKHNSLTLNGWGYSNRGHWESGTYCIEIWYKNTCLKSKTFTIH